MRGRQTFSLLIILGILAGVVGGLVIYTHSAGDLKGSGWGDILVGIAGFVALLGLGVFAMITRKK